MVLSSLAWPDPMLHQFSVSSLIIRHYLVTANHRYCSQPIPTDESLFEHSSQEYLSMEPSSIISSLKDLSNPATAIEFLLDVGHKFCLLHVQSYT